MNNSLNSLRERTANFVAELKLKAELLTTVRVTFGARVESMSVGEGGETIGLSTRTHQKGESYGSDIVLRLPGHSGLNLGDTVTLGNLPKGAIRIK